MAILLGGLLGKSRKSIGDTVTYVSKGQQIIRMKAANVKDANTEAQQINRSAFSLVVRFFRIMSGSIRLGFPERKLKHSAYNAFVKYNMPESVIGSMGSQVIDYSRVIISRGSLLRASDTLISSTVTDRIDIGWRDNSNGTTGFPEDLVILSVYNPLRDEAASSIGKTTRSVSGYEINVPSSWQGETVHVWLTFLNVNQSKASDSVYIGSVSVSA